MYRLRKGIKRRIPNHRQHLDYLFMPSHSTDMQWRSLRRGDVCCQTSTLFCDGWMYSLECNSCGMESLDSFASGRVRELYCKSSSVQLLITASGGQGCNPGFCNLVDDQSPIYCQAVTYAAGSYATFTVVEPRDVPVQSDVVFCAIFD